MVSTGLAVQPRSDRPLAPEVKDSKALGGSSQMESLATRVGLGNRFFFCAHPERHRPVPRVRNWALLLLKELSPRSLLGKAKSGRQADIPTTFSPANPLLYVSLALKD